MLDPPRRRWDRSVVSGESDDVPSRPRGAVRPPPSLSPDDAPNNVDVPRMSPPPPSLGALVEGGGRRLKKPQPHAAASPLWVWGLLALATAALTAYFTR